MARDLTNDEKSYARSRWPRMDVERVVVSGEATHRYNCLAWTLGITSRWMWPWRNRAATKAEFNAFYRSYGFRPTLIGEVAAFGTGINALEHGSISGSKPGPRWESKCGGWLRIQHGLNEIEGGIYGRVMEYYTQSQRLAESEIHITLAEEDFMAILSQTERERVRLGEEELISLISDSERELVTNITKSYDAEGRRVFEEAYAKWQKTWYEPECMMSSNPGDYATSQEFRNVVALGEDIVPLLIERLTDPSQFFALQAVAQLARPELIITTDLRDPIAVLSGEQGRAAQTVRKWLAFEV